MDIKQAIDDLNALEIKRHRRVWKPFMEKYNIKKFAEIGVFEGQNFKRMIEHRPELAVAVDAWIDDEVVARNDCGYPQSKLNELYNYVRYFTRKLDFVKIMRMYTIDAASFFPDELFDLVYIDADHSYEGCKADIEAWYPKVKKGGFVLGDDYSKYRAPKTGVRFGVIQAVDEFAKKQGKDVYKLTQNGWAIIK
jgi:hypothetical protein